MILKPVRNRKCGHLYDSDQVPLECSRRLQCPVLGSDNEDVRPCDLGWDVSAVSVRGLTS